MSLTPLQRAFTISSSFIILTIFAATWWAQSIVLELNEKACRLNFGEDQIAATLALKNTTSRLVDVNIKLELIDQSDRLRYRAERDDVIKSGNSEIGRAHV